MMIGADTLLMIGTIFPYDFFLLGVAAQGGPVPRCGDRH